MVVRAGVRGNQGVGWNRGECGSADRDQGLERAEIKVPVRDGGGGHRGFPEAIDGELPILRAGGDHMHVALLAGAVDFAVSGHRRGRKAGGDGHHALLIVRLAVPGVHALQDAGVTVSRVGDAVAPRRAHAAVIDGERIGSSF